MPCHVHDIFITKTREFSLLAADLLSRAPLSSVRIGVFNKHLRHTGIVRVAGSLPELPGRNGTVMSQNGDVIVQERTWHGEAHERGVQVT